MNVVWIPYSKFCLWMVTSHGVKYNLIIFLIIKIYCVSICMNVVWIPYSIFV